MPTFSYVALDAMGHRDKGRIEALSGADAYRKLRERGLQPSKVVAESMGAETTGSAGIGKSSALGGLFSGFSAILKASPQSSVSSGGGSGSGELPRLTTPQLLFFTEELAELLEAGLQLEGALKVIEQRQERSPVKIVAASLRQQVREGISFSNALRNCGRSFDPLYCNLVAAGEAGGSFPRS